MPVPAAYRLGRFQRAPQLAPLLKEGSGWCSLVSVTFFGKYPLPVLCFGDFGGVF